MGRPIIPHLWFDNQASEAAEFYCSIFPGSGIERIGEVRDTPSGDCELVSFRLGGATVHGDLGGTAIPFHSGNLLHRQL